MLKKIASILLLFTLILGITTPAAALPVRPTVTVVNNDGGILSKETIQYTNAYIAPQVKAPVVVAPKPAAPVVAAPAPAAAQPALTSRSDTGNTARLVVKTAYEQLGKSYVGGSNGPNSFDCSGLAKYIYQQVGINLPRTAADQFQTGIRVTKSELLPGDLVFFGRNGSAGIGHVGVYVGDNNFIHAANSRLGVVKTSLSSSYYVQNYKGAVRLVR